MDKEPRLALLRRGELPTAFGIAGVAMCLVWLHFVMIGLLAVPAFPVALGLLLNGIIRSRNNAAPPWRQVKGGLLLFAGMAALLRVVWFAVGLAHEHALHMQRASRPAPPHLDWLLHAGSWFIPTLFMGFGLLYWTNWSRSRRLVWSATVLMVPLAAVVVYRFLAQWLPIDA